MSLLRAIYRGDWNKVDRICQWDKRRIILAFSKDGDQLKNSDIVPNVDNTTKILINNVKKDKNALRILRIAMNYDCTKLGLSKLDRLMLENNQEQCAQYLEEQGIARYERKPRLTKSIKRSRIVGRNRHSALDDSMTFFDYVILFIILMILCSCISMMLMLLNEGWIRIQSSDSKLQWLEWTYEL